jgi:hypothetical protein
MRNDKTIKLEDLRLPGTRRVFEAIRMMRGQVPDIEDDDTLPEMPAGVLMKSRQGGGGRQHWE